MENRFHRDMFESAVPFRDIGKPPRAFMVKCCELIEVTLFQSPRIASPQNNVQWNLHIQLLASPQIDIFAEEDVMNDLVTALIQVSISKISSRSS